MNKRRKIMLYLSGWALLLSLFGIPRAAGQAKPFPGSDAKSIYERLLPKIMRIKIFDNHSHPGFSDDPDVDAMALPADSSLPFRLRSDNPEWISGAKLLFGYPYGDLSAEHLRWLKARKAELRKNSGIEYFSHVLDEVGIETAVANRVSMPGYLDPARFRWVFFVDSFLFPFDSSQLGSNNLDRALNFPLQRKLFEREMKETHLRALPSDLNGYLAFVTRVVEANRSHGGVGIKFEIAYFRSLHFDDPSQEQAAAVYDRYRKGGAPSAAEYKTFQDYIFRYLLREAGRLHLPVQIHTAAGPGDYFDMQESNVMRLENVLRDPRYNEVTFILLHGGYPLQSEAIWLASKKNVYLDSSLMGDFLYPQALARTLREWLEIFPKKIVFGSDAFPFSETIGAEESYWLAVESARTALAAALAEMISEAEINENQALDMAEAYLHDTASKLYRSKP